MRSKPTDVHLDVFAKQVIATLPEDIGKRRVVLVTLLAVLPKGFCWRHEILLMLEALHAHERAQVKFQNL